MSEDRMLLRRAFIDATLISADKICASEKTVKYSDRHRKRISSMGISAGISTKAKLLIAVIAAALLLTGCAIFHEQIAGLILSFGDGFVTIEGDNTNAPEEIEHAYVATYIPEGFTEVEREEEWYKVRTVWQNDDGNSITLVQNTMSGGGFGSDTKYAEESKIETANFTIFCIKGENHNTYYWSDNVYMFKLKITFNLQEELVIKFINSME